MSGQKKRSFQIEAFKHRVLVDPMYAEKTWKILEHAIHEIYNHNASGLSFEELFRHAYNMVLHKFGEKLYSGLVTTMTYHLKEMSKSIEAARGELFLEELNRNWAEHNKALRLIRGIMGYMDRTFVPNTHKTPVRELGLNLWRDVVIHDSKTQSRLLDTLLELVHRERRGEVINRGLMRNIIKMLMDSTVYQDDLEKHFVEVLAFFYRCESQEFMESYDCGNYLKKAERRLMEEMERESHKITNVVEKEMIESHMNRLVHMEGSGLVSMLVDDKYDDLGRMYRLFRRVQSGLVIVQDAMTAYIQDTGLQLFTDPEMLRDPVDVVQRLLDLKDKCDKVISLAFNNDKTFQNALNSSFEYVINLNARSPEFISLFVDDKLQKGLRGVSEEDVEVVLDKVRMFFHYLQENDKEMIEGRMNRLVHMESSGLANMLVYDKYDDLGRMYSLFRKVQNGLVTVQDVMTAYIRDTGKQLVTDPERLRDPVDFVQRLLDLKDKYDKVISLAFNNDKTFQNALNSSFEYFINMNARSPELISLFVDNKLRKGPRGVSEEDVEVVLDKVMMLFRYLQQKDVFEKYYKQHLAERLLSGKTVSDDAERSLIVKLKTECGDKFTSKLEGMFTDRKTSEDTMHEFYSTVEPQLGDSPTLTVKVLTTGLWPTQPSATCNLPAEILLVCEKFKSYYVGTHAGRRSLWQTNMGTADLKSKSLDLGTHTSRRLSWQTNMGTADLKATFGKGQKHELNVSTYQMCVLMLFNNADWLTYKEIEQATEIPANDLKRCLQSLACVEGKNVLRKEPKSKEIAEEDAFFFNDKFTSKFFKIKIGTVVAQRESEPENLETRPRVEEDRKPQIEAAIVRIMKSRRVLDHDNIVAEVTKQLQGRFLPDPVVVKKGIESLIEREFLERDKTDGFYRYLA